VTLQCTSEGCPRPHYGRGLCGLHYVRWRRKGKPESEALPAKIPTRKCIHKKCESPSKARGYCNLHFQRILRGTNLDRPPVPVGQSGRECSIEGCNKKHAARGFCGTHYAAFVIRPSGYSWYSKNKTRSAELGRSWRRQHPARALAIAQKRREIMVMATPSWLSEAQWDEMDGIYSMARDLTAETGEEHQVDHIWPLAGKNSCGLHVPWNLQILTGIENRKKGNSEPSEAA